MMSDSKEWIVHSYTTKALINFFYTTLKSYPFMVCNEANLNLFHSLQQKIVISEHNELAVVSVPFAQLQGNTHNDYLRYGKRIIHEGYRKYNTNKAIHYA